MEGIKELQMYGNLSDHLVSSAVKLEQRNGCCYGKKDDDVIDNLDYGAFCGGDDRQASVGKSLLSDGDIGYRSV